MYRRTPSYTTTIASAFIWHTPFEAIWSLELRHRKEAAPDRIRASPFRRKIDEYRGAAGDLEIEIRRGPPFAAENLKMGTDDMFFCGRNLPSESEFSW